MRLIALAVVAAFLLSAGAASAAAPVQGSISGPITKHTGKTFTVKTSLSPTGSSKVTVSSKTTILAQVAGTKSDLRKGVCLMANGTEKNGTITAQRITVTSTSGACTSPFPGRGAAGGRPGGSGGFTPPANAGFAVGSVTAVKGSTLTVKGANGTSKVVVSSKTQIGTTRKVGRSALTPKTCAFVRGTSSDKGKTVKATNVSLSQPRNGSCTAGRRPA